MKFLIAISALLTVASAQYLHHPYAGFHGHALGLKSAPCVNAANVPVPCAAGNFPHLGYGYHGHGKREADAEPAYLAGLGYAGLGYAGLGYAGLGYAGLGHAAVATPAGLVHSSHVGLCTNYLGDAVPCGGKKKREAEADAEADPAIVYSGLGYGGLGYGGLGYAGLGYAGLGYAGLGHAGLGYAGLGYAGLGHAAVATPAGLVHSSHVGLCTNYLGAAVPCGGKKKREAEADAEADPAIVYSGLGYGGLGYAGLGYAGLGHAGLGYAGLGHVAYAAPAVVAAAPAVVAPVATVHNAVLGTADLPNPVHGVAHTLFGTVHSSHVGVCTNFLGEQVSC